MISGKTRFYRTLVSKRIKIWEVEFVLTTSRLPSWHRGWRYQRKWGFEFIGTGEVNDK